MLKKQLVCLHSNKRSKRFFLPQSSKDEKSEEGGGRRSDKFTEVRLRKVKKNFMSFILTSIKSLLLSSLSTTFTIHPATAVFKRVWKETLEYYVCLIHCTNTVILSPVYNWNSIHSETLGLAVFGFSIDLDFTRNLTLTRSVLVNSANLLYLQIFFSVEWKSFTAALGFETYVKHNRNSHFSQAIAFNLWIKHNSSVCRNTWILWKAYLRKNLTSDNIKHQISNK